MDRMPSEPPIDAGQDESDETPGSLKPEKVEDRPSVGTVEPEDYPEPAAERESMTDKRDDGPNEDERRNPGSTDTDPAGKSAEKPAEGADDTPPEQPGSPQG